MIPDTKIKRREISEPIVDAIFDEVSIWDGYKFGMGKYGLQPFTKGLDGGAADITSKLIDEVSRSYKMRRPCC